MNHERTKKEHIWRYTSTENATYENGIDRIKELMPEWTHTAIAFSKATIELDGKQKVKKFTIYDSPPD